MSSENSLRKVAAVEEAAKPTLVDRVSAANAERLEKIFKRVLELAAAGHSGANEEEVSRFVLEILHMPVIDRASSTPSARIVEVVIPLEESWLPGTQCN